MFKLLNKFLSCSPQCRWCVFAVYVVIVTLISIAPSNAIGGIGINFPYADKIVHFVMYGFFVLLFRWVLIGTGKVNSGNFWIVAGAIIYGVLMELLQYTVVSIGRSFEVADIIANSIGAITFWFISGVLFKLAEYGVKE